MSDSMACLFISNNRAKELLQGKYFGVSGSIDITYEMLSEEEREKLGGKSNYKLKIKNGFYVLTDEEPEGLKKRDDFLEGADELRKIMFSLISENEGRKRQDKHKGIEAVADKLQEEGHPLADKFIKFYELLKAVETIRNLRKIRSEMPRRNGWYFSSDVGLVQAKKVKIPAKTSELAHDEMTENQATCLKDIPVENLIGILIASMDLPSSITL